jgi:hypothetical protein
MMRMPNKLSRSVRTLFKNRIEVSPKRDEIPYLRGCHIKHGKAEENNELDQGEP